MEGPKLALTLAAVHFVPLLLFFILRSLISIYGASLRSRNQDKRDVIFANYAKAIKSQSSKVETEDGWEKVEKTSSGVNQQTDDWSGIIGFFHPFCNAGGGGERVLWAAIAATQQRYPKAICAVYTGDHEIDIPRCISIVKERFDITLQEQTLHLVYLSRRDWVLSASWPRFTLLGQSFGSIILAYEALAALSPDIFIDTMGYAFGVALCKYFFPKVPTAAYIHYPTISTDMLESLDDATGVKGLNAGKGTGSRGRAKKIYWKMFAALYGWVGKHVDIAMCNSTWTYNHIAKLWSREQDEHDDHEHDHRHEEEEDLDIELAPATIVYPPCPVTELKSKIQVSEASETKRDNIILYIAQFRPEKNHSMILRAFSKHYHSKANSNAQLVLIGSVRSNTPDERHVYALRLLTRELKIQDATTFICDAPFTTILEYLQRSNISVNGMYNEHFGIGNVEGLAAGLIPVVHNSGGPKLDIVVPYEGQPVGFHAETEDDFADAFAQIDKLSREERIAMRLRGRESAGRFSEEVFVEKWDEQMEKLVKKARRR